jgi:hypothetical protein
MTATHKILRNAKIEKTTAKAYLLIYSGQKLWVPIALVSSIFPDYGKGTADIILPLWFAQKNGFSQL